MNYLKQEYIKKSRHFISDNIHLNITRYVISESLAQLPKK